MSIIYVAVDIEKAGSFLIENPTISVGFFVGDEDGNCLSTHKFNIEVEWPTFDKDGKVINYGNFEKRCWEQFWAKLSPDILARCLKNPTPLPPKQAWQSIAEFLDNLEEIYPEDKYKIKFLTDNASFDIASIDYALEFYTGRPPMRYSSTGKYRSVKAADDMLDMLPIDLKIQADKLIDSQVKHDHDPVNDAHHIYLEYIQAIRYTIIRNIDLIYQR